MTVETRSPDVPSRQIRASHTETTVRVYQAYSPEIATPAIGAQTFVAPFGRHRMTWIKPSFAWMMYRSGWGTKPGQERVLGIDITRAGLEWALSRSCLSHFDPAIHANEVEWRTVLESSPVRIQWDPERSLALEEQSARAIQIGLSGEAVSAYVDSWITRIEDITTLVREIEAAVKDGDVERAKSLAPIEAPYPLPKDIARRIACTSDGS